MARIAPNGSLALIAEGRGSTHVMMARVHCTACGATQKISGFTGNYEGAAKKLRAMGWEVNVNHDRTRCPACIASRMAKRKGESPVKEESRVTNGTKEVSQTPMRPLTMDERSRIRRELDIHFDDAKGAYLDGYSDKRIGEELKIPWAHVRDLRETAYGPLLSDGIVDQIRDEAAKVKAELTAAIDAAHKAAFESWSAIEKRFAERLAQLRG